MGIDNRRFYIFSPDGNKSFDVVKRGNYTATGEPLIIAERMTWSEAVELVERLNSNTN